MLGVWVPLTLPSTAFRHIPPRKDVVNQCLEFGYNFRSKRRYAINPPFSLSLEKRRFADVRFSKEVNMVPNVHKNHKAY